MRTNDVTVEVLLRRCEELRRQRDAAVTDNKRLRATRRVRSSVYVFQDINNPKSCGRIDL